MKAKRTDGAGQRLYGRAKTLIPGGTQLLSKRPEMFLPDQWPAYYSRASGVKIWDLDDNGFIDMSYCGIGTTVLGFADDEVDDAVHEAIRRGSMCTLNCPEEVELAELLCELHPWAQMVRYARCGGEGMAIAVRIARARTRRDKIAICGYHGWHDWYLSANLGEGDLLDGHLLPGLHPAGVPRGLKGTALPFHYNRLGELEEIVSRVGDDLAAVVMEPIRAQKPEPGFLEAVHDLAHRAGALLVFDEVTAAWRLNCGGAHLLHNVVPDIAVFAKAMSNGYPMAAIIGSGDVMSAAQDSFISSTYWTERIGPTAALATIKKHKRCQVHEHLIRIGLRVQEGWREAAEKAGLRVRVDGIPPLAHLCFEHSREPEIQTLYNQLMLDRGFITSRSFYATYAHQDDHVDAFLDSVAEVFAEIRDVLDSGELSRSLQGPVVHSGFVRLT